MEIIQGMNGTVWPARVINIIFFSFFGVHFFC